MMTPILPPNHCVANDHHEEKPPYHIYKMKREVVESVIEKQFAKYEEADDLEPIIDVEGEKECSYIKKVLEEPVKEAKRPSWSVADMLRKEPPKRQKTRRKPLTPLCYRKEDELIRPYDDLCRVPYMHFYNHNVQDNYLPGNFYRPPANIGSHQFSILGHRKIKAKPVKPSPLDVKNLISETPTDKKKDEDYEIVEIDDDEQPQPSPKPKYVPRFFQNLAKEKLDEFLDEKTLKFCETLTKGMCPDENDESICVNSEKSEIPEQTLPNETSNFAEVISTFIGSLVDRGALDLTKASSSSSQVIRDKLNDVKYNCDCKPRRKVNPSRSSAKAGILEPLPTTCSPSPPPQEPPPQQDPIRSDHNPKPHQNFVFHQQQQVPYFPRQFVHYDNLFKMAVPTFPAAIIPQTYMNGPFLVPTLPPPKRARLMNQMY